MNYTITGVFENDYGASNIIEELSSNGIEEKFVEISHRPRKEEISSLKIKVNESRLTKFFSTIFGKDKQESETYSGITYKMDALVMVNASNNDEAERVVDILIHNGATAIRKMEAVQANAERNYGEVEKHFQRNSVTDKRKMEGPQTKTTSESAENIYRTAQRIFNPSTVYNSLPA